MNNDNLKSALFILENALTEYAKRYNINKNIEVVFLGSQSILFHHKNIRNSSIVDSYEIDIIILIGEEYRKELDKISNHIDFVYGYGSELHDKESYYIDNMSTPENENYMIEKFPKNWRNRSGNVSAHFNNNIVFTFLNIHDIAILKLFANRDKDIDYVKCLIQGSILNKKSLLKSLHDSKNFIEIKTIESIKMKINSLYSLPQINIFKKT